jgi:hypothetical protein
MLDCPSLHGIPAGNSGAGHLDIPGQSSIIILLYCGVWIPPQLPFGARFWKKEEGEYENRQL